MEVSGRVKKRETRVTGVERAGRRRQNEDGRRPASLFSPLLDSFFTSSLAQVRALFPAHPSGRLPPLCLPRAPGPGAAGQAGPEAPSGAPSPEPTSAPWAAAAWARPAAASRPAPVRRPARKGLVARSSAGRQAGLPRSWPRAGGGRRSLRSLGPGAPPPPPPHALPHAPLHARRARATELCFLWPGDTGQPRPTKRPDPRFFAHPASLSSSPPDSTSKPPWVPASTSRAPSWATAGACGGGRKAGERA